MRRVGAGLASRPSINKEIDQIFGNAMSRDQRPARTVVIAPDATRDTPQRRALDATTTTATAAGTGTGDPAAVAPAKSHTLLLSGLFLFACIVGAAGVALAPWLLAGR